MNIFEKCTTLIVLFVNGIEKEVCPCTHTNNFNVFLTVLPVVGRTQEVSR